MRTSKRSWSSQRTLQPSAHVESWELLRLSAVFLALLALKFLLVSIVIAFNVQFIHSSFLDIVSDSWDSHYFVWIAEHGYPAGDFWQNPLTNYYAYMPVYPIMINLLSYLTRDARISAFMLSNMFYYFTLVAFYFVVRLNRAANRAVFATFLFGLFPLFATYGFFSYSDSVYLLFAIASWYFFAKQDYAKAGIIAAIASATRVLGVLLTLIYLMLIIYGRWRGRVTLSKNMLVLASPVIVLAVISLYFFSLSGNPFAIVDTESKGWGVTLGGPLNILRLIQLDVFTYPPFFALSMARFFYLSFFLIGSIIVRKINRQFTLYSLCFMLFVISLSGTSVYSEPRYALAAWPVFLLYSNVKDRETAILVAVGSIILTAQSVGWHLTTFWT